MYIILRASNAPNSARTRTVAETIAGTIAGTVRSATPTGRGVPAHFPGLSLAKAWTNTGTIAGDSITLP